jgi:hypothetical protein
MFRLITVVSAVLVAVSARTQMPHEVLLLVNRQSQPSLRVANTYAAVRQIPQRNIVYLDIPESAYGGTATVTPEEFTALIWEPANAVIADRGLEKQILAWIYSVDFPIRVKTDANDRRQMSVGGLTFMRNQLPNLDLVEQGKYLSPVFAGPNERLQLAVPSLSLRRAKVGLGSDVIMEEEISYLKEGLGDEMPLPSMMLGYIGENGNDLQTVLDTIDRGVRSDYFGLRGNIFFIAGDDVRSDCREWQYYPAMTELQQRGVIATVTTNFPVGKQNIMGILMGAETVDPSAVGSFAPGAMAEHLTSWSAEFQKKQTKMTEWLKAGATASAGAVVEPYSNPNKFPSARFYLHYASGCTMLESFYQSIACPLQTLLLGEPLARPYAPRIRVKLLGADVIKNEFTYVARAISQLSDVEYRYSFLLDGKLMKADSDTPELFLSATTVSDGYHELRAVAWPYRTIEYGAFAEKAFTVNKTGRSLMIDTGSIVKTGKYTHGIRLKPGGAEAPETVRLVHGERILDEKRYADDVVLTLDEQLTGEGPVRIQAVAVYSDGMEVASPPLSVTIQFTP